MRELHRMQKLDHIRVQMTSRPSVAENPFFNKTIDFHNTSIANSNFNNNHDSLTQDSLYINNVTTNEKSGGFMRAKLAQTPLHAGI